MNTNTTLDQWIDGQASFPEDEKGQEIYEKIKFYSAQLEAPKLNKSKVFGNIKNAQKIQSKPKLKTYLFRIAAILVLAIGLLALLKTFTLSSYQTLANQSEVINLPDDSEVLIQAGSTLSYNPYFWFLDREVELEGEAFFDVAKGKIFTVDTPNGKVKVLGTKFNVKTFNDKLSVVCYEGRVEVSQNKISEVITKNQFIEIKNDKVEKKSKINLNQNPSTSEYYQIINLSFSELIKDIERYFDVKIDTANIETNKNFTGQIPKNDIKKALNIVSKTYQLKYQTTNENNYIFVSNEKG